MRSLALLLLCACSQATRTARFLGPEGYLLPDDPRGQLAEVTVTTGLRDEPAAPYEPELRNLDGRTWQQPVWVTSLGEVHMRPLQPGIAWAVYTRHHGLVSTDFTPVTVVTGAFADHIPLQLHPLPRRLPDEGTTLPLRWLHNVYRGQAFDDGDLLLLEATDGETVERYLFRTRRIGWRTKLGAGLLVRMPLPELTADPLAPVVAATVAVGYRPRTRSALATWAGDKLAGVVSIGVGTTRLPDTADPLGRQLGGLYDAALGGGGIELYDVVSVQVLANLSSLGREVPEARATLAIGFDAVQFGRFTRDAGARLFQRNTLDEAPQAAE